MKQQNLQKKRRVIFMLYGALIAVLICAIIITIFFGVRDKMIKGSQMGVLRDGVYYYSSHEAANLWTEEGGAEKIEEPKKATAVRPPQGAVYLESRKDEKGNLYFRPEGKTDGFLSDEEVLLSADTGMKYLIFDEDSESDYLIGWAPEYQGEKVGTTIIWKLVYNEDRSRITGVKLIDQLQ